jgi:acyl carrier protein
VEQVKFEAALIEELSLILDAPIDITSDLPGECGLDSFGTMQVIVFLEDSYDIEVPEEMFDINNFASVQIISRWALPLISGVVTP